MSRLLSGVAIGSPRTTRIGTFITRMARAWIRRATGRFDG
jgi:hypothetical protein